MDETVMEQGYAREDGWPTWRKSGWTAAEFDADGNTIAFTARQLELLCALVEKTRQQGIAVTDITREVFDHPELHESFADWVRLFKEGQGLVKLRGFPVRDMPLDDIWRMYWGIGAHFGIGVSQNTHGHLQGTVTVQPSSVGQRFYATAKVAQLHSDRIDVLSLLCINQARRGGENAFVSLLKIWELIEIERPDLLPLLKAGYPQDRYNEQPEGCAPFTPYRVPIFGEVGDLRSAYFGANASLVRQEMGFSEMLTDEDREALNYLEKVKLRPELSITQTLSPGEAVFINNMELAHARTAFEDGDGPFKKRLLLRLWLQGRPKRPIPRDMRVINNPSGMLGIEPKDLPLVAAG